jgi:hypothetical protein
MAGGCNVHDATDGGKDMQRAHDATDVGKDMQRAHDATDGTAQAPGTRQQTPWAHAMIHVQRTTHGSFSRGRARPAAARRRPLPSPISARRRGDHAAPSAASPRRGPRHAPPRSTRAARQTRVGCPDPAPPARFGRESRRPGARLEASALRPTSSAPDAQLSTHKRTHATHSRRAMRARTVWTIGSASFTIALCTELAN